MAIPFYNKHGGLLTYGMTTHALAHGHSFRVSISTDDLGSKTTPDDMIQLHFTSPSRAALGDGIILGSISVRSADGTRFRFLEAPTGGMASAEGESSVINKNRELHYPAVTQIYYNATEATGGLTMIDEYLGSGRYIGAELKEDWLLAPSTVYAVNLFNTSNVSATITLYGTIYREPTPS